MSRPLRIGLIAFAGVVVLALAVVIGGIFLLRSDWFFQQVRQRVVAEMEKSIGGKVELQGFRFDWNTLVAEVDGLVIHGTEPTGEAPLLRAAKATIGLKLISLAKKQFDVASVDVTEPQANLLIGADGRTNIPEPKIHFATGKSVDETILDLAVGRLNVTNGVIQIKAAGQAPKRLPWSIQGEKLAAQLDYQAAGPSYSGAVSMNPLHGSYGSYGPVDAAVEVSLKFERDHLQVLQGKFHTATSQVEFSGDLRNLRSPQISGKYQAHLAAQEVERLLAWRTPQGGTIDSSGAFHFKSSDDYRVEGNLQAVNLSYRDPDLHFDHVRIASVYAAEPGKVELTGMNASLLGGQVFGRATLSNGDRFDIKGTLIGFGATGLANLLHTTPPPVDALIAGPFEASGSLSTVKDRRVNASAKLTLSPAGGSALSGFIDARYDGVRQSVELGKSFLALPNSRVDFSGGLGVQPGAYSSQLQVRLASSDLKDLLTVAPEAKELPVTLENGHAEFDGAISGSTTSPVISGHVTANNIVIEKQTIEAFSADVNARSSEVQVRNGTLAYQTMRARLSGTLGLHNWKPDHSSAVTASTSMQNADISNLLALVGQTQIPIKGSITAEAQLNGTLDDPRATANIRPTTSSAVASKPMSRPTISR